MSRAGRKKTTRVYWGCTTFGCERGFDGTEEAFPADVAVCPACGGDLSEITVSAAEPEPAPAGPELPSVTPEMLAAMQARYRADRVFALCKNAIVGRDRALWPPEVIGAWIAEQWMQRVAARMQEQLAAETRARAARAGLVVPSPVPR